MTLKSMLQDYADFNLWANTEMVQWLKTHPVELVEREMPSSFPSIKTTLLHIWSAEDVWLQRLKGGAPTGFIASNFQGTAQDVFDGLLNTSRAFAAYLQQATEETLAQVCDFKLLNGTPDQRPRIQMIHHCMNHSTYHRGQIVTMARNFGITDPPGTDFIKYVRIR